MDYMVTILRVEQKETTNEIPKDSGKRYQYLNINTALKSDSFESLSVDEKRDLLEVFLKKIGRDEIKTKKEFDERERIIVNPKGDYGLDNTVFDQEMKIPKHLLHPIRVKNGNG